MACTHCEEVPDVFARAHGERLKDAARVGRGRFDFRLPTSSLLFILPRRSLNQEPAEREQSTKDTKTYRQGQGPHHQGVTVARLADTVGNK